MNDSFTTICQKHGLAIEQNLAERAELYTRMKDPVFAQAERARALKDIVHFFNFHAWTHEPRPKYLRLYGFTNPCLPFLLFDFQKDMVLRLVDHIETGKDVLVEKSRDMGVSWMVITTFLWFWLQPVSGQDFLMGSRKWEYVDKKGAQDTLFEKIRYNLYRLQKTLLPNGFSENDHDNVGFIQNPETGSYFKGEGNNANFGSGGRYKAALMDEFAKWEETDEQAWTSMGDASPCRIPISSPWGLGRKFAQLRFSGAIEVLTLHWTKHPIKSAGLYKDRDGRQRSIWYDEEIIRRSDDPEANIGQELDINYLTSGHPYFDNMLIQRRLEEASKMTFDNRFELEQISDGGIRLVPHPNGRVVMFKEPDQIHSYSAFRYCIGADVAEGLEKSDFSVLYVYDRVKGEDVCWFIGRLDTDIFALLLNHFAIIYDDAWIAPEANNHGLAVISKLKTFNVNIIYQQDFSQWINKDLVRLGWSTNQRTRPVMCSDLREAIKQGVDGIHDPDFWREALTFILNEKGKPEAATGKYDDRVMAQAIKLQIHKWLPAPLKTKVDIPDYGYYDHGRIMRLRVKIPPGSRFV